MQRGVLHVSSRPTSPEREAEYNAWYEVHLREICALPGFRAAQRLAPVQDDGPYIALYAIEAPDLEAAVRGMLKAVQSGGLTSSDAIQTTPPPQIRLLRVTTEITTESTTEAAPDGT
jgi:hypothetical protein